MSQPLRMTTPHSLILGQGLSGKTTIAKAAAKEVLKRKRKVLAYTGKGRDGWPEQAVILDTPRDLENALGDPQYENAAVFIDEIGSLFSKIKPADYPLIFEAATGGRHFGHSYIFIGQLFVQMPKADRAQMGQVLIFSLGAESYARDTCADAMIGKEFVPVITGLEKFHYLECVKGVPPVIRDASALFSRK